MRAITESLNRLYHSGKLTEDQLLERVQKGTITEAELDEILNK